MFFPFSFRLAALIPDTQRPWDREQEPEQTFGVETVLHEDNIIDIEEQEQERQGVFGNSL